MRSLTVLLLAVVLASACRPERDISQAEGTFGALVDAYDDGDSQALWDLCSATTHELLTEAHDHLKTLKELISTEFPVGQRKQALHSAGTSLLDEAPNARALFAKVSRLDKLTFDGGVRYGAEVKDSAVDLKAGKATFTTQSGQTWVLARGKQGAWKTTHLEATFQRHLDIVKRNVKTAEDFVKKAKEHETAIGVRFKELVKGH